MNRPAFPYGLCNDKVPFTWVLDRLNVITLTASCLIIFLRLSLPYSLHSFRSRRRPKGDTSVGRAKGVKRVKTRSPNHRDAGRIRTFILPSWLLPLWPNRLTPRDRRETSDEPKWRTKWPPVSLPRVTFFTHFTPLVSRITLAHRPRSAPPHVPTPPHTRTERRNRASRWRSCCRAPRSSGSYSRYTPRSFGYSPRRFLCHLLTSYPRPSGPSAT